MPLLTADFISYRGVVRAAAVVGGFCALLFILFLAIGLAGGPTLPNERAPADSCWACIWRA